MSTKEKNANTNVIKGGKGPVVAEKPSGLALKVASLRDYFEESRLELKKVSWPSRKEIKVTTLAVLILVVVMSIFLGVLDLGLVKLSELILSLGK